MIIPNVTLDVIEKSNIKIYSGDRSFSRNDVFNPAEMIERVTAFKKAKEKSQKKTLYLTRVFSMSGLMRLRTISSKMIYIPLK